MAQILCRIELDVANSGSGTLLMAKEGDFSSRFVQIALHSDGAPLRISEDAAVLLNVKRPDGAAAAFAGSVNGDGTLTVPLTGWMLELPGVLTCDVSVSDATGGKLTSTVFSVYVEEAVCPDGEPGDEGESVTAEFLLAGQLLSLNGELTERGAVFCPQANRNYQIDLSDASFQNSGAWVPILVQLPDEAPAGKAARILLRVHAPRGTQGGAPTLDFGENVLFVDGFLPNITAEDLDILCSYAPRAGKWQVRIYQYGEANGYSPAPLALGESADTAYRGDRGAVAYAHAQDTAGNPHAITPARIGAVDVAAENIGKANTGHKYYAYMWDETDDKVVRKAANTDTTLSVRGTAADAVAVKEALGEKLDKVTDASIYGRVYGISTMGEQITRICRDAAANGTLPIRDKNGTFQVGDPTKAGHPATKSYVDARDAAEYMLFTYGYSEDQMTAGTDYWEYTLLDPTGEYIISGSDGGAYLYSAGSLYNIGRTGAYTEDYNQAWSVGQHTDIPETLYFYLGGWGYSDTPERAVIFVTPKDKCGYCARHTSCFIEGTRVLIRDPKTLEVTEKNIEDVVAGDHMAFWSPKLNRLTQTRTVVPPLVGECESYHRLSFSDGRTVDVFGNQFFWDVDLDKLVNWLDMVAGETRVCTAEGDIITYTGAEEIVPPAPVKHYTLMTYRSRYLANGIQVGDKVELFYPRLVKKEELVEYWNALPEKDKEYFKRKWCEGMRRRNWKFSPEYHEAMKPLLAERAALNRTIAENQSYLDSTDYLVAKLSEGLITEAEFAEPREKRQEARDAINAARDALTALKARVPEIEKAVHETVCPPGRYRGVFAGKTRAETEPLDEGV